MQARFFLQGRALGDPNLWIVALIGLYAFPDVVNIGFGKALRRSYLYGGLLALTGVAAVVGWTVGGSPLAPPLAIVVSAWLLYTFSHLGISFLLASLLATPGCEMRSLPQLWGFVSRKTAKEHYCPGVLTPIDRWEARFRKSQ